MRGFQPDKKGLSALPAEYLALRNLRTTGYLAWQGAHTWLYPYPSPGSPPPTRLQSLPQEASRKSCQKAPLAGRGGPARFLFA